MAESQNISQNPVPNNGRYHSMQDEPLPPTPRFRPPPQKQQHQQLPLPSFSISPQQQPAASSSTMSSLHQGLSDQQSTIVGPSDHYGIQHQYGSSNNYNNCDVNDNHRSAKLPNTNNFSFVSQEGTKVCVTVDSGTPIVFKVPVPPSQITLSDLKLALPVIDKPNYKYFFKSPDSEYVFVKEEIQDDDAILPIFKNRVVAWIVTPGRLGDELVNSKFKSESDTCNLTYSNPTSYEDTSSSLMTTDIETTSYYTETDDDSNSCSNYSETTYDTFVSQRRNRHYKSGKSPTHHYHGHHQSNSPYRYSSKHIRNPDNISPSSSQSSSSDSQTDATAVQHVPVHLVLTDKNFLGLRILASDEVDQGIFVERVLENSAAALDGRIEECDKLIQVNDVNLEELSNEEAIEVLKDAVKKRGPLKLVVAKVVKTDKNDNTDGIISSKEAIHPIDTEAWVAHAQAITIANSQEHANSATSSPSYGSNAQDTDCIRPSSAGMARLNSGLRLNRLTTDMKEIIQHMKIPEIGLEIKDREWLKIQIPKAFLGSDIVTWLERNVYGFNSNRDAKKFASRMLKEGYIRDPISKKSFSSKSYYTFVI